MFDTHCHLNSLYSLASTELVHSINPDNYYLAVSTQQSDWTDTLGFTDENQNVLAALGIHPWFVAKHELSVIDELELMLSRNKTHALGEIGLDFQKKYIDDKVYQLDFFSAQLELAERYSLPVSLHIIKAHNEAIRLLKKFNIAGVVHGLGTSVEIAQQYLSLGLHIGINAVSCRSNARRYHQLIDYCGIDNLVLETDYPNICLPGHNHAALQDIDSVAKFVADRLNMDYMQVVNKTDYNARQIFLKS